MRGQKLIKGVVLFAFLGLVFATMVPTAVAQTKTKPNLTGSVDPQGDQDLKPLQNSIVLNGKIKFTGDAGTSRTTLTGINIKYEKVSAPTWATVVISPPSAVLVPAQPGAGETQVAVDDTFKVTVTASDQAPAFQDGEIVIKATSTADQAFDSATINIPVTVKASYFSIIDVVLPETIKVERPQTPVLFPISVTNFGNGPTKIQFEVTSKPENDKFQVLAPPPIQLEARQTGGTAITKDVNLQVQTPYKNGYMNEPGTVVLKITSAYANDATLVGDTNTVSVLVTTRGFYVPGVSPILVVGLVGVLALVVRMVRRD